MNKLLHIPFSTAMYLTDGIIIFIAMLIDFQLGLYAVASMILSAILVDRFAIEGKSGYTVFIVTDYPKAIQEKIYEKIDRGITKVKVVGGYSNQDKEMIICTVERRELYYFKVVIKEADPKAFTFVTKTKEAIGYGFSRGES